MLTHAERYSSDHARAFGPNDLRDFHHGLEDRSRQLHAGRAQAFVELRANTGGPEPACDPSGFCEPGFFKHKNVLHGDQVAFHAHAFRYVRDAARTVAEARHLHEHVDGRTDLLAHGTHPHVCVGHTDHDFQASDSVARIVGVHGGQRAVMARIHGLQHVEGLFATALTDDDAVGAHTEGVDDKLADANRALSFHVRRAGLHPGYVGLAEAQLSRVFDGDDALVFWNVRRENVEQSRFAGAGTAGDDDVQPCFDAALEQLQHAFGHG